MNKLQNLQFILFYCFYSSQNLATCRWHWSYLILLIYRWKCNKNCRSCHYSSVSLAIVICRLMTCNKNFTKSYRKSSLHPVSTPRPATFLRMSLSRSFRSCCWQTSNKLQSINLWGCLRLPTAASFVPWTRLSQSAFSMPTLSGLLMGHNLFVCRILSETGRSLQRVIAAW